MIRSCWLQTLSYLIVEMVHCSVAAVVQMICYIQARPTVDTFPITATLFRYKVGVSICCLIFPWQQKRWSEIIALPMLTESAL